MRRFVLLVMLVMVCGAAAFGQEPDIRRELEGLSSVTCPTGCPEKAIGIIKPRVAGLQLFEHSSFNVTERSVLSRMRVNHAEILHGFHTWNLYTVPSNADVAARLAPWVHKGRVVRSAPAAFHGFEWSQSVRDSHSPNEQGGSSAPISQNRFDKGPTNSLRSVDLPLWRAELRLGDPVPPGMVWVPVKNGWQARELNSCFWCGRPMLFKEAAFDKKAILMWGAAIALSIADIEVTQNAPCFRSGTCREGNPLIGNSRASQYGIRLSAIFGAWMGTAYLRKGDRRFNMGGMKKWWIFPLLYQGGGITGLTANLSRKQPDLSKCNAVSPFRCP